MDLSDRPQSAARAPLQEISDGRSEAKNLALTPRHAPVRRRAEEARLCRGQGFGPIAPAAPHRPENRHVSRPAGPQGQDRSLIAAGGKLSRAGPAPARDIFAVE